MSDGGRERASHGVEVWKSSQNVDPERSAVRSIAWLDLNLLNDDAIIFSLSSGFDGGLVNKPMTMSPPRCEIH
jgi:hypothetical protein